MAPRTVAIVAAVVLVTLSCVQALPGLSGCATYANWAGEAMYSEFTPFPTSAISVGAWIKLDTTASQGSYTLMSYWENSAVQFQMTFSTTTATATLANGNDVTILSNGIDADRWTHVLLTFDGAATGGPYAAYVNGDTTAVTSNFIGTTASFAAGGVFVRFPTTTG